MKQFKVFYIYTIDCATKTDALAGVEKSRQSSDPAQYLTAHFAKEEVPQTWLGQIRRQAFGK